MIQREDLQKKPKIMASSPITSWHTDGKKVEAVTDFIFLGSKITVDSDGRQEMKRHLLLGRKAMTNLDSVLKSRHHFADKGPYSQSYGFSSSHVQICELDQMEAWCQRIDGFIWSNLREIVKDWEPWHAAVHGVTYSGHDSATEEKNISLAQ